MTKVFTYPDPVCAPASSWACRRLRRWLRNVLFLHLDLWPWGTAGGTVSAMTARASGSGSGQRPEDKTKDPEAPTARFQHEPVLLKEALEYLQPSPGRLFIDATLGGGGHAAALLQAGANVLGFDQDEEAILTTAEKLAGYDDHFVALRMNFRTCGEVLDETGVGKVDGILADLGVSSFQLDTAERGFSFQQDGPLDMRMSADEPRTAADIVNEWSEADLRRIFTEFGEEPLARRAAHAIVKRREQRPFHRTLDLAETLASVLPRRGRTHPATRVFQALRIETNRELEALCALLDQAPRLLKDGGRIAVICFHSLESRIVKQAFQRYTTEWLDRPEWPEPRRNPDFCMRLLTRKPVEPSAEEITRNPRARSATLRVAEKLPS